MSCPCGYADECDGETAVFLPLGHNGDIAVRPCKQPPKKYPPPTYGAAGSDYYKDE